MLAILQAVWVPRAYDPSPDIPAGTESMAALRSVLVGFSALDASAPQGPTVEELEPLMGP